MKEIKIQISMMADKVPPPAEKKNLFEDLKCRIDYAVECIECDEERETALEFLRNLHGKLLRVKHQRTEHQVLIDKIKPVLGEYGSYHIPDEEEDGEDYHG